MSSDYALKPGDIVAGKYQIIDTLGVGGSGAVYRAQKIGMKLRVALKMMHAEHPDGDVERLRFQREAELVKKLQHPNIVRLMDYGHAETGVPYLAFALLEGMPMDEKIKTAGALEYAQVARFSQQGLRALDKAHSLDVVHRDIKPANIFLSKGVLGEVVQMLDFGLAKLVHDAPGALDVTRAGSVLGTPRYMAPEQVRGEKVGPTADIYAFGLVMCEMLMGEPLVKGTKDLDLYVVQGSDREHALPAEILNSPFASIIQRAVAKPLNVRYRQASQMLADVSAVVDALTGGEELMSEADMEATVVIDASQLAALSIPTASSAKLRKAFNMMADKQAEQAASAKTEAESPAAVTRVPDANQPPKVVVKAPPSATAAHAQPTGQAYPQAAQVHSQAAQVHPQTAQVHPKAARAQSPAGQLARGAGQQAHAQQAHNHNYAHGHHAGHAQSGQAAQPHYPQNQHYPQAQHTHPAASHAQAGQSYPSGPSSMPPSSGSPRHSGPISSGQHAGYQQPHSAPPSSANELASQRPEVRVRGVAQKRRTGMLVALTCVLVAVAAAALIWFVLIPRI